MKDRRSALLLLLVATVTIVIAETQVTNESPEPTTPIPEKSTISASRYPKKFDARAFKTVTPKSVEKKTSTPSASTILSDEAYPKIPKIGPIFTNPKDLLLQEVRSLDENAANNRIQEELAKAIKAKAQESKDEIRPATSPKPRGKLVAPTPNAIDEDEEDEDEDFAEDFDKDEAEALKAMKKAETGADDDLAEDDEDDDDDADDTDDDYDDDDEDDDEDDIEDEEDVMTDCPKYCRCSGQYAEATTARCTRLITEQNFSPQVAHLRIENAGEISLEAQALHLRGLQQLESITIVDTKIGRLDKSAFNGEDYIFAVNLTRNALIDIDPHFFENNTRLNLLTIAGQPLGPNWSSSEKYLLNASSVTELDFSSNEVARLPREAFSKMPNLVYISLRNNVLENFDNNTLDGIDTLDELDLSENLFVEIPVRAVQEKDIQTLRIASNDLTKLNLREPSKLISLDASKNRIKVITKDDLAGASALEKLFLSSNGIKRIHQHAFSTLEQLTHLDISDNKLTDLTEHHLRSNARLQVILMNDNRDLEILPVFKTIGLEYNTYSVYRFECANCGLVTLSAGTFDAMPALTTLNLAANRLTGFPSGLFRQLSSLRELDLSDNVMSTIDPKMFTGAKTLTKLKLAGNRFVSLQVTPFLETPGLTHLDVSRCRIQRIWSEARQPLKSLRFLSVRSNQLKRITLEELKAMPRLSGIDVSHNDFTCSDEFVQAIQWFGKHGVKPTKVLSHVANYDNSEDYVDPEDVRYWSDLAKIVCYTENDGSITKSIQPKYVDDLTTSTVPKDNTLLRGHEDESPDYFNSDVIYDKYEDMFDRKYNEYDDLQGSTDESNTDSTSSDFIFEANPSTIGWRMMCVAMAVLTLVIAACQIARVIASRRGRGPVIRPPMILRQGLVDNKNCGLVYKPLQEEIATPAMPKRGSFYSSSTFHYDKIVPESV